MSFVGPRPEVPGYVAKYTPDQRRVLLLKPGITDLATLEFRNEEEILREKAETLKAETLKGEKRSEERGAGSGELDAVEEVYLRYCLPRKIELNLEYARRASVLQDMLIILRTLFPFLAREHGQRTTEQGAESEEPNAGTLKI